MHRKSIPYIWRNIRKRYLLLGIICNKCKTISYPLAKKCEKCKSTDISEIELSGKGIIESYTKVHIAPDNFKKQIPYIIALVKLEQGPKIITQIVDEDISIGTKVESCLRRIYTSNKNGIINYGLKFKVIK